MFKFLKIFYKCGLSIVIIDKNQILNPFGKKKCYLREQTRYWTHCILKCELYVGIIYHTIVGYSYVYV